jgi:hypothetical protein
MEAPMPTQTGSDTFVGPLRIAATSHLGVKSDVLVGTFAVSSYSLFRDWVRTPGFMTSFKKKLYRRLDLPMNNFTFERTDTIYPVGSYTIVSIGSYDNNGVPRYNIATLSGALAGANAAGAPSFGVLGPGDAQTPSLDVDSVDSQAKGRFLLEAKDQKVNLLQVYAERRKTANLFNVIVKGVAGAVRRLKAGDLPGAAKSLGVTVPKGTVSAFLKEFKRDQPKAIANGWLAIQYGIRPLYNDLVGSAELVAQKNLREIRSRVRKSATRTVRVTSTDTSQGGLHKVYTVVERRCTVKYTAYYSTQEVNHTLAQAGFTNIPYLVHELTPWSFVLDWLLPIGNYLNSLDATNGLSFDKGCKVVFDRVTVWKRLQGGHNPIPNPGVGQVVNVSSASGYYERKSVSIVRTKILSFPDSSLPSFRNPFSVEHSLNLLALLKQTVRYK